MKQKILINLLSKQPMPNFIAIMEELPDRVFTFTTKEFSEQVKLFERITGTPHTRIDCNAYDMNSIVKLLKEFLKEHCEDEIVINFTGGTKIMSMALVLGSISTVSSKTSLIYIDTFNNQKHIVKMDDKRQLKMTYEPISIHIPFDAYVQFHNESIASKIEFPSEIEKERYPLSEYLTTAKDISKIFSKQKSMKKNEFQYSWSYKRKNGLLDWDSKHMSFQSPSGKKFDYRHTDSADYFTGCWLEEYVFQKLYNSSFFDSVFKNIVLSLRKETILKLSERRRKSPFTDKNELDTIVTKGTKAAIIECKAGNITQDHIYKLSTLKEYLLGPFGEGVLVSKFMPSPHIIEKARDNEILLIYSYDLKSLEKKVLNALN